MLAFLSLFDPDRTMPTWSSSTGTTLMSSLQENYLSAQKEGSEEAHYQCSAGQADVADLGSFAKAGHSSAGFGQPPGSPGQEFERPASSTFARRPGRPGPWPLSDNGGWSFSPGGTRSGAAGSRRRKAGSRTILLSALLGSACKCYSSTSAHFPQTLEAMKEDGSLSFVS